MAFGHEKLDVYRAAIGYVGWVYRFCEALAGHRNAKDQLLRAAQAIPLNIAEGNGNSASEGMRFTKKRKSTGRIKSTPIPMWMINVS